MMHSVHDDMQDVRTALRDSAALAPTVMPGLADQVRRQARRQRHRTVAVVAVGCAAVVSVGVPAVISLVPEGTSSSTSSASAAYLAGAERSAGRLAEPILLAEVAAEREAKGGKCAPRSIFYAASGTCLELGTRRLTISHTEGIKVLLPRADTAMTYDAQVSLKPADTDKLFGLETELAKEKKWLAFIVDDRVIRAPLVVEAVKDNTLELGVSDERAARKLVDQLRPN